MGEEYVHRRILFTVRTIITTHGGTGNYFLPKRNYERSRVRFVLVVFTIVPTRLFINEKGLAKVVVAIARGKKEYDKRDSIRERDDRRRMDRAFQTISRDGNRARRDR